MACFPHLQYGNTMAVIVRNYGINRCKCNIKRVLSLEDVWPIDSVLRFHPFLDPSLRESDLPTTTNSIVKVSATFFFPRTPSKQEM